LYKIDNIVLADGREACVAALEYGRQAAIMDSSSGQSKIDEQGPFLHPWPFLQSKQQLIPCHLTDISGCLITKRIV